jgi:trehalose synthase
MWQGAPVIGSKVGGIATQIAHGQTGFLVDPLDVEAIIQRLDYLLTHPEEAQSMGEQAREHVRTHFLIPELVRRYMILMQYYSGLNSEAPDFRLNDLSYSEVLSLMRPVPPFLQG